MEPMDYITFSVDTEKLEERVITGLAAPYGVVTRDGRKQSFAPGSFGDLADDVKLNFNHDQNAIIGSVFESEDTEAGLVIKARISKSARGEEVYTLLREGHLNKFSVGIVGIESRDEDGTKIWTKVDLHEVSVVPRPAFKTAAITAVYSAEADSTKETEIDDFTMNEEFNTKVGELEEAFSDLERKVVAIGTAAPAVSQTFGSAGEAVKALATGNTEARQAFAFTGATTADGATGNPAWVNRTLEIVEENREVLNLFKRSPLPSSGNSIEYPMVSSVSGTVGVQATEGADLPYMEVAITTASAPVKTYGGYSSLSRQAIERSDVSYLDAVLRYQAAQYAKATNGAVRAAVLGATGTTSVAPLAADNGQAWTRMVLAARRGVKLAQGNAGVVLVSGDVYDRLFTIVDTTGRPVFNLDGTGSNTFASAGTIAGLPVAIDDAAPNNTAWVLGSDAVTVFEQPGAPVRLQDENIINLTKDFSLYGYMAVAVTRPAAIVRLDVDLV